jgi:hypothetical protein
LIRVPNGQDLRPGWISVNLYDHNLVWQEMGIRFDQGKNARHARELKADLNGLSGNLTGNLSQAH